MKKTISIIFFAPYFLFCQQTINDSIYHNNLYRSYKTYVPAIYSSSEPTPLIFNFHGKTGKGGIKTTTPHILQTLC